MFLNFKTSDGHKMATAYSGLQKSLRIGHETKALYWAGQIGKSMKGAKGYPNALKKRLCQNALEDAASWTYASRLLEEVPNGGKLEFEDLIPWVHGLVRLSKTHSTAWLNRVAAQEVHNEEKKKKGQGLARIDLNALDEVEFAVECLKAHRDGKIEVLKHSCQSDGALAVKLYKYVNSDPLVFHAWQMHCRRPELRDREIDLTCLSDGVVSEAVMTPQDLPQEWFDKHTKEGKQMDRGYEHFFRIMELHPRVYNRIASDNACVRGGNDPYESDAKDLYLDFKLHGHEARVRHLLDASSAIKYATKMNKRGAVVMTSVDTTVMEQATSGCSKKLKVETPEGAVIACNTSSSIGTLKDSDVFQVPDSTGLIGFKNFTVIGTLLQPLEGSGLQVSDSVFIKMGESYETCLYAKACDDMRSKLDMVSMNNRMSVVWLLPTYDVAELVRRTNPLWESSITKRMNCSKRDHCNADGAIPSIIMEEFQGHDLCHRKEQLSDGMELVKILLFRKFVGAADTNGKNIMINKSGRLFSVDETAASTQQLEKYRNKGLITSQNFHSALLEKASNAFCSRPKEVAEFIQRLTEFPLPIAIGGQEGTRLATVHAGVPFDEGTTTLLSTTPAFSKELIKLATRLRLM